MNKSKVVIEDLDYVVLPGQHILAENDELYNRIFKFWRTEWKRVFADIDPNFILDECDFSRQSKICAILAGDEIVGIQTLGVHQISDFLTQSYFRPYTIEFYQNLIQHKVRNFQTMQYFLVNEHWSARATGHNFAAIVLGLSFYQQKAEGYDATITLARKDVPATSTANKFNMIQVGSNIQMHNVPVGQLLCLEPENFPRPEVTKAIETLWNKRMDYVLKNKTEENYESVRNIISVEN